MENQTPTWEYIIDLMRKDVETNPVVARILASIKQAQALKLEQEQPLDVIQY